MSAEDLQSYSISDLSNFDLNKHESWGCLKRAIDGDTQIYAAYYNDKPFLFRCRLYGIDTAEMRSSDPEERVIAMKGKDFALRFSYNRPVWITFHGVDSFGRWLVKCYTDKEKIECLNYLLIEKKLAVPYTKPKTKFKDWPTQ